MATTALMDSVKLVGRRGLLAPFLVLVALAMMMLPLPAFVLDLLISFNIALSLVILLAVIYAQRPLRSEEHTSELQSLMRNSYAVFCLKKKKTQHTASHTKEHTK